MSIRFVDKDKTMSRHDGRDAVDARDSQPASAKWNEHWEGRLPACTNNNKKNIRNMINGDFGRLEACPPSAHSTSRVPVITSEVKLRLYLYNRLIWFGVLAVEEPMEAHFWGSSNIWSDTAAYSSTGRDKVLSLSARGRLKLNISLRTKTRLCPYLWRGTRLYIYRVSTYHPNTG